MSRGRTGDWRRGLGTCSPGYLDRPPTASKLPICNAGSVHMRRNRRAGERRCRRTWDEAPPVSGVVGAQGVGGEHDRAAGGDPQLLVEDGDQGGCPGRIVSSAQRAATQPE